MRQDLLDKLRPWQRGPAEEFAHLLRASPFSALDMSVTGSGKTYLNAAVALDSGEPTLVVCPKIAIGAWERAMQHFGGRLSVINYEMLRTGRTPYGWWDNPDPRPERYYRCTNCQQVVDMDKWRPCYTHPLGIHCIEEKRSPAEYGKFHFHPGVRRIIFDEVHRCGALDSLNADMLVAARRHGVPLALLSATPATSPLGLKALGYALGLHEFSDYYSWVARYGVRRDPNFRGLKWFLGKDKQWEVMRQLRAGLRGIRIDFDDIPGFPPCDIQAELYDLDDPEAVDSCYKEMAEALEELDLRAKGDKDTQHPLTKLLRAQQKVELLKVPVFAELGQDCEAKGFSVVWFVKYRQTIDELKRRFPDAGIIDGQTGGREEVINTFQQNKLNKLIVNLEAGKEAMSLQDLDGQHPRYGIISPTYSATTMQQVFGRLRRDGGKSRSFYRVVFANKTVEVKLHRAVCPKLNNLDALTDDDLSPRSLSFS